MKQGAAIPKEQEIRRRYGGKSVDLNWIWRKGLRGHHSSGEMSELMNGRECN